MRRVYLITSSVTFGIKPMHHLQGIVACFNERLREDVWLRSYLCNTPKEILCKTHFGVNRFSFK